QYVPQLLHAGPQGRFGRLPHLSVINPGKRLLHMAKAKPARSSSSRYTHIILRPFQDTLADEVRKGLTASPKSLPCKYFYDARGLALFDKITELPEYYLTRIEMGILAHHAAALLKQCPSPLALAELGSGSSVKTRLLIEPCLAR